MEKIIVEKFKAGKRIDKFLKEGVFLNEEITRGEIIRQIKSGHVLVSGKQIKPSYILKENDEIDLNLSEKVATTLPNENVFFEIIFKNENFLIINKPAGLQVHPDFKRQRNTLANGLLFRFPEISEVGDAPELRPGIVHRLDQGTSGVMLVARNQKTFLALKEKFKNREIEKKYWAVVFGTPPKSGTIDAPMARAANYKKQIIAVTKTKTKIRSAVTEYETLKSAGEFSLVEASPKTGRTHQIRVHLSSLGHPILGDEKYTKKDTPKNVEAKRLMLHAKNLKFELDGQKYEFEAPLPDDFQEFLGRKELLP